MHDIKLLAVSRKTSLREALARLDLTGAGLLLLVGTDGCFERTVTDGDLRRLLLNGAGLDSSLEQLPPKQSQVIARGASRREALDRMNHHGINHLPVIDENNQVVEVLDRKEIDTQILLSTPHMGDTERDYVEEAFRTNWIAPLGPNVDAFERELAEKVGARHAAALSSGTAAIHLGLRILGVGQGDRVFCSTLTFAASANPIVYQGAEPVFIDSDDSSWNMSPLALERAFEAARKEGWLPKAVIVVSLYGQSADMDPLMSLCERYGVPILEDAAESLGATYKGRASGTFGRIGVYSFNGNKIITTSGGGMLVSDDADVVAKARYLSTQARDPAPHYQHSEIGFNYRMSNILAGVGRGQLRVLDQRVESRREVFASYRTALADIPVITWMPEPDWSYSTHWLTACTISAAAGITRLELMQRMAAELIEVRPLWKPMHLQPVFAGCRYFTAGSDSVADRLFDQGLCLPSGSNMPSDHVDRVVSVLRKYLR
ncbi:aminotransferase class I/II-fold pyridoxal phosphate-dependent enzyme [Accumulibacter sp.]|uniref:aminotransferase class I/II-fold pyridoxal phosphate-dependent enzyme n=1 Tax=Accumulibacter sp. TaxID=2053492 RepID=UPI002618F430|nr:aminotransferase class I/II-fold pyridoxal phosphate-dependent enzyme [Accumulibacter sp.]